MAQNGTDFWTIERIKAAQLVAENRMTDAEIAKECGSSRRQLLRWKSEPVFQARVKKIITQTADSLQKKGIRDKDRRLAKLDRIIRRIELVIKGRAADMEGVPGGQSGLLVRDYKGSQVLTDVYKFDAAMVKEYREAMKQAAIELGEWTEKRELTGTEGTSLLEPLAAALQKAYGKQSESDT